MSGVFDYLQECRNAHANPSFRASSPNWPISGLCWGANREHLHGRPQLFPASDSVCGRCSGPEKDPEETEQPEDDVGQLSESDAMHRQFRHQRGGVRKDRKFQRHRALNAESNLHKDPGPNIHISSTAGQVNPSLAPKKTPPQESFISQVPLSLQIKVSGQRGSLGISIAGGKGSLPYKEHDEGVFISRVSKGGSSEKAGIHVGDRLLEVNGLNMQRATHHEAVSALRNAGSCIKMKVLRERMLLREVCVQDNPAAQDTVSQQQCSQDNGCQSTEQPRMESSVDFLSKIEAIVYNGNGISDLDSNWTSYGRKPDALMKSNTLQVGKHTMTIPRIILTHPSTSDEEVEPVTMDPEREVLDDSDIPDGHIPSDFFNSAFYPP